MNIDKKDRDVLKSRFKRNAIPTEGDFADLIDAAVNQKEDGLAKPPNEPLSVEALPGGNRPALRLYERFSDDAPSWTLSLQDGDAAGAQRAFVISDGKGRARLSIDHETGDLAATGALHAKGGIAIPADGELKAGRVFAADLRVTGAKTWLGGNDGSGYHWLSVGSPETIGPPGQSPAALGFHLADKRITVGLGWAFTGSGGPVKVGSALLVVGPELQIDHPSKRGGATGPLRRALAHDTGDALAINYGGDYTGGVKVRGVVDAADGVYVGSGNRGAHLDVDGALYRYGNNVYLGVDDNLFVRKSAASAAAFHFDATKGRLGVGKPNPTCALDVSGDLKVGGDASVQSLLVKDTATATGLKLVGGASLGADLQVSGGASIGGHLSATSVSFNGNMRSSNELIEIDTRPHRVAKDAQGNAINYAVLHVKGLVLTNHVKASGKVTCAELAVHGTKLFEISHPLEPKNKTLAHASLEGPEAGVYYRGEGQLAGGRATVTLPAYFEGLTRKEGRTVMITPRFDDDEPISALAATGVEGGCFSVRAVDGNNPSQRFYWEVKAARADVPALEVERPKRATRAASKAPAGPIDVE